VASDFVQLSNKSGAVAVIWPLVEKSKIAPAEHAKLETG